MKKISDYRALARMILKTSYGVGLLAVLCVMAVSTVVSLISRLMSSDVILIQCLNIIINTLISLIVLLPLNVGYSKFLLEQAVGRNAVSNLMMPFGPKLTNIVKISFIRELKLFLWLFVPWILGMLIILGVISAAGGVNLLQYVTDYTGNTVQGADVFAVTFLSAFGLSCIFAIPGIIKSFEYAMIPYILAENPDIASKEAFKRTRLMMNGNKFRYFLLSLSFIGWFFLGICLGGIGIVLVMPYYGAAQTQFYIDVKSKAGFTDFTKQEFDYKQFDNNDSFGL